MTNIWYCEIWENIKRKQFSHNPDLQLRHLKLADLLRILIEKICRIETYKLVNELKVDIYTLQILDLLIVQDLNQYLSS